ncbi:hypothetical protein F2Q69_00006965 [Brassica cretica]|uniref:Uncharacterized protein n=1 Tax=Brassica cretica TaxID=69181 RepID=A0A8S9NPI5_BRACR|nr:hypothetical protein F2Q69_00006965 [Brassica cretica]
MVTTKEIARAHDTNFYVEKMGDMVLQQRELAFKKHIRKREKTERLGTPERMIPDDLEMKMDAINATLLENGVDMEAEEEFQTLSEEEAEQAELPSRAQEEQVHT